MKILLSLFLASLAAAAAAMDKPAPAKKSAPATKPALRGIGGVTTAPDSDDPLRACCCARPYEVAPPVPETKENCSGTLWSNAKAGACKSDGVEAHHCFQNYATLVTLREYELVWKDGKCTAKLTGSKGTVQVASCSGAPCAS